MTQLPHYIATATDGTEVYRLFHVGNYHYQILAFKYADLVDVLDMPNTEFEEACKTLNEFGKIIATRYV